VKAVTIEPPTASLPRTDENAPYQPDERMRWGLWDATIGILVFLGLILAGGLLVALTPLGATAMENLDLANFVAALVAYAALGAVVLLAARKGLGSVAKDFGFRIKPIDLAVGLGIGIAVKIVSVVLTGIVVAVSADPPATGNLIVSDESLWVLLNAVVIAVIVAPILEELFFRGLVLRAVYNTVVRWRGRPQPADVPTQFRAVWVSILVSGLAFTALHLYQSTNVALLVILGLSTLLLGVANGFLAIRTGRLGAAIVAHVVFNGSGVASALLLRALAG